jgi:hypothetical protein
LVLLQQKKQWQQVVVTFFLVLLQRRKWWQFTLSSFSFSCNEEGNGSSCHHLLWLCCNRLLFCA